VAAASSRRDGLSRRSLGVGGWGLPSRSEGGRLDPLHLLRESFSGKRSAPRESRLDQRWNAQSVPQIEQQRFPGCGLTALRFRFGRSSLDLIPRIRSRRWRRSSLPENDSVVRFVHFDRRIDSTARTFVANEIKPFTRHHEKRTQDRTSFLRRMPPSPHNGLALIEGGLEGLKTSRCQGGGWCSGQKGEVRLALH
jgi:hypothetical protein